MKLAFLSVPAADYLTSKNFYESILALPIIREFDGEPHRFTDFALGNISLKVFEWTEPWLAGHYTSFMVLVDDMDGVLDRVSKAGFEVRAPEITRWQGRIATIKDPFGNLINLLDAKQQGNEQAGLED